MDKQTLHAGVFVLDFSIHAPRPGGVVALEVLVRRLLSLPQRPAVVLVELPESAKHWVSMLKVANGTLPRPEYEKQMVKQSADFSVSLLEKRSMSKLSEYYNVTLLSLPSLVSRWEQAPKLLAQSECMLASYGGTIQQPRDDGEMHPK